MKIRYNTHYEVTWGDTLRSIAEKMDIDAQVLSYYNNVRQFYIGVILTIPKEVTIKLKPQNRTLQYYLQRYADKRHLYKFYN